MIELNNIHKNYFVGKRSIPVLRGIDLKVQTGEFIAIMGPSGSGKSTLLNIIGCLDEADVGKYYFDGQLLETSDDNLAFIRCRRFGFVFQLFNLIPRINAQRNVELPMVYARNLSASRRRRAQEVMESVNLGDRLAHFPSQLSGGQQQRVAIARALVNNPDVIIADEPTGSLDSTASREIMELLSHLHAEGKTVIIVTHDATVAAVAQRIIQLRDGMIEKDELI